MNTIQKEEQESNYHAKDATIVGNIQEKINMFVLVHIVAHP